MIAVQLTLETFGGTCGGDRSIMSFWCHLITYLTLGNSWQMILNVRSSLEKKKKYFYYLEVPFQYFLSLEIPPDHTTAPHPPPQFPPKRQRQTQGYNRCLSGDV